MGKTVIVVSPGPFDRLEIQHLAGQFILEPAGLPDLSGFAAIILDTSTIDRTGKFWPVLNSLPMLVIDHHSARENFGDFMYVDPEAPATALMVLELVEQLGTPPSETEAMLLLLGICTDTGFFRHLEKGAPEGFAAVSRLTAAGASMKTVFLQMFGGVNLAERKLLGRLLQQCEEYYDGQLLFVYLSLKEKKALAPMPLKTEEVYRLLQMVEGGKILAFMKQEDSETFSVSFRSHGLPRVDLLARELGGGGHQAAAGCELKGEYLTLKQEVLTVCRSFLEPKL